MVVVYCLNRTNVGLKSSLPPPIVVPLNCLNRTNVGLKLLPRRGRTWKCAKFKSH